MNKSIGKKADPAVVLFTHKNDYFFAKICVASIRYFYPDLTIYLVKDYLNGCFSSFFLEKYYKVIIFNLRKKNIYGWTSSKLLFYLLKNFPKKKVLILDADTIFIGKVLDNVQKYLYKSDFLISPEYHIIPHSKLFERIFFNSDWVKSVFSEYIYPGYTFNTAPIFITPGILQAKSFLPFFNSKKFPFWQKNIYRKLHTLDQSLLNILLPTLARKKKISLNKKVYMKWSESLWTKRLNINDVLNGKYPYIIHWAGIPKKPYVKEMTRGDILFFFQKKYYSRIPFGYFYFFLKLIYLQFKKLSGKLRGVKFPTYYQPIGSK